MKFLRPLLTIAIVITALIAFFQIPPLVEKNRAVSGTRKYITEKYGDKDSALTATQLLYYSSFSVSKTNVYEVRVRPRTPGADYLVLADMKKTGAVFGDSKQMPAVKKAVEKVFAELFEVKDNDISITIYGFRDSDEYPKGLTHPNGGVEYYPELLQGYYRGSGDVFEFLGREQAYMWITAKTLKDFGEKDIEAMNDIGRKLFSSGSEGHISLYRTIDFNTQPNVVDFNLIQTDESYSLSQYSPRGSIETHYYDRSTMDEGKKGVLNP